MGELLEMPRPPEPPAELNPQQWEAVRHGEGPLLVVAGAGTGKTRVITRRIAHLLESDANLPGEAILGLTFTDNAAAEMKHRVVQATGERGKQVWLSTFHAFCLQRILLEVNPGMQAVDEIDQWILLRRNLKAMGLKHYLRLAEPGQFLGDFRSFFSRCQDELVAPDDYEAYVRERKKLYEKEKIKLDPDLRAQRGEEIARQEEVARAYRVSDAILQQRNLCTFGMQLLLAVQELRTNHALRERLQKEYRYILVDEFQDTNIAQIELLWLLGSGRNNIVAVGDNDQAIYRFRGASFGSFTIFLERFTGMKPSPGHLGKHFLPLTQNYRSSQRILRVAGQVIKQNEKSDYLPEKRLVTENAPGERIHLVDFGTQEEEAHWVADEIEKLHGEGHPWHEFAVLYRMHIHRERLVEELQRRDTPFVIRNLSILRNTLVRDLIAYLRLIARPWDNVACARVLGVPAWGLMPADVVRLAERTSKSRGITMWDAVQSAQTELPFAARVKDTAELVLLVTELRARMKKLAALEMFDELVTRLGLAPAPPEARPYLDCFAQFIREWQHKTLTETWKLPEFIGYLELFEEAGGAITLPEKEHEDAVQLTTVHNAKGLEFEHVFVLRMNDGAFPAWSRRTVLEFPPELMKEEQPKGDFRIQEERRLFYVALTRAKRRLTLTTLNGKRSRPSPFLEDFLQEPAISRMDVKQYTPKVTVPPPGPRAVPQEPETQGKLFAESKEPPKVYSQIAGWAEKYRPPVLSPLLLSASTIDVYESCPQKYLFEQGWSIRGGPSAALTFGSVMHTALRHVVDEVSRKRKLSDEDVKAILDREWRSAGFEDSYQEEGYRKDGLAQLLAFHATYSQEPADVVAQEKTFELPLENDVVVKGRMDQINRLDGGEVEIVDYKTGRGKDEKSAKKSLQLSIYALAARDVLEMAPARLTFYNLGTNFPVSTEREEKDLKQAREQVGETADNIRAGNFPAKPGFACRSCEFRPICPAHESRSQ